MSNRCGFLFMKIQKLIALVTLKTTFAKTSEP